MVARTAWIVVGLVALAIGADPALAQTTATPIGSPAEWFSAENYPPEALRAHQEGRVVIILSVDTAGRPTSCRVKTSSGTAVLDAGTCAVAMQKAYFTPATDRRGHPLAGDFTLPVRWVIPGEVTLAATIDIEKTSARDFAMHIKGRVTIGSDGTVTSCTVEPPAADAKSSPCAAYPIGQKIMPSLTRGGRPIGAQILMRSDMETIYDP